MKESHRNEIIGTLLVLFTAVISGFSIVANKFFVTTIDPLVFTSLRALIIGLLFLLISVLLIDKKKGTFKKTSWKNLILIGVIGGGFAFWLFFSGLKLTMAGRAAFLHKTLPIYALIFGFIFLKERVTKKHLVALLVMLVGLVLMQLTVFSESVRIGDMMVIGATMLWALENTISKKAMMNSESNWVVTFARMFFGSIVLFAIIFLTGRAGLLLTLTVQQLIYIGVSGGFLFLYVLTWYWGLKYINLSKAATILLLAPVISLIFGMLWLGETVTGLQLIGSVLILVGAYLVINSRSEKRVIEV